MQKKEVLKRANFWNFCKLYSWAIHKKTVDSPQPLWAIKAIS